MTNKLNPNESLQKNKPLYSTDQHYRFVLQDDGNLVLYTKTDKALWNSGTNGHAVENCTMQPDGNLVIYGFEKKVLWAAGTDGHSGAYLVVQDDGNVVIYDGSRVVWNTNTHEK
ncbi:hypothetical protein [Nostoc sp. UHCC 0252]|uniref:hypothetical protein n=1 Tax=Nostoc sp. UHCC 0252 TaxID=3110241 RepID=UPI002B1FDB78|nr:hypothetical protein [Nostoc sp. UHCC 0252]MEA5603398.1 hypothetical protein [Nostoc sp. UHCC 0252]